MRDMAAVDAGIKARQSCRDVVLAKLGSDEVLTLMSGLLFQNLMRVQYLISNGFQLLARITS